MRKRPAIFFVFFFLIIISVILLAIFQQQSFQNATGFSGILMRPVQGFFYSASQRLFHLGENSTIRRLQETNQKLSSSLAKQTIDEKEMKALKDQFAIDSPPTRQLLPARVIGSKGFLPGISTPEQIILDKGTTSNVAKGQVVLINNNLIGKISRINSHYALVDLIIKKDMALTAKTNKTKALGIIKGQGTGLLLDNVILSDTLEAGDLVITKGEQDLSGSGYPPDLVIGKITSIDKKSSSLFQSAGVQSLVNFTNLTIVFIFILNS